MAKAGADRALAQFDGAVLTALAGETKPRSRASRGA